VVARILSLRRRPRGGSPEPVLPAPRLQPVFIEPSGRRWRAFRAGAALLLLALAALACVDLSPALAMIRTPLPGPDPTTVASRLGSSPEVIGTGPMVRVAAVHNGELTDPFTGAALGVLTDAERATVGSRPVVVQRYGYGGGTRQIALTFDDGPDPQWTPKVLAVLARYHVHATFFVTGRGAANSPDLLRRIVREGNALGNHSLSHPNLSQVPDWRARLELSGNADLLAQLTGQDVRLVRPPYDGGAAGAVADEELAIARAQRLGYVVASYDDDTHDWAYGGGTGDSAPVTGALPARIPLPSLDGRDLTLLMHDAGGNRAHTVDYLEHTLIPAALAAGYTFVTVPQADPGALSTTTAFGTSAGGRAVITAADHATRDLVDVWLVYPNRATGWLFVLGVLTLGATGLGYALLALLRRWRRPPPPSPSGWPPVAVTVLIAAYNEAEVIEATLRSLLRSTYPVREFLVVDDGSTDATAAIVTGLSRTLDGRIRLISQANGHKPAALNTGLARTDSEIVVTVDADTQASPTMVADLVRHFEADPYGTLGAVAGVVRVGNRRVNVLTRWQGLEYLSQIGVERAAHDLLGAIMTVPGACAGWRREAVLRAGGFSQDTLAEDCDLTLALHRMGWRVTQDDVARADTEAPEDLNALLKQRVRWTFGTMQAIRKHHDMVLRPRYGWLGTVILPWAACSIALPVVTIPFIALMTVVAFTSQGPAFLGGYYLAFTAAQALTALIAVRLLRESLSVLSVVPLYRAVYDPLRSYLLYTSCLLAVRGVPVGWNKLTRTGTLNPAGPSAPATPAAEPGAPRIAAQRASDQANAHDRADEAVR
jgi:cellulose synthase/poly-beta-1,6-N-acetylglucosamine synthase-like glycosyltransferase/peptidoglycan/xylan/chitin deacetylase (PgdA/CDA1 family)